MRRLSHRWKIKKSGGRVIEGNDGGGGHRVSKKGATSLFIHVQVVNASKASIPIPSVRVEVWCERQTGRGDQ